MNMKTFQCGILLLSDYDGNPIDDVLPYVLLLNDLTDVNHWFITGEYNADGIFHTHCLLLTTRRTDSIKRSLSTSHESLSHSDTFKRLWKADSTLDIAKMQKCHKPESMFGYVMKAPKWIASNHMPYIDYSTSLNTWNLNEKFKQPKEQNVSADVNKITEDILNIVLEHQCKTLEDCMKCDPETMSKYLHRPGLLQIVNNCITFAKATGTTMKIEMFFKYDCNPEKIHQILLHQGINVPDFDLAFFNWITKTHSKKNTIVLYGPSNTGKSTFVAPLKHIFSWGEVVNGNNFNFEALIDQSLGYWEEPLINAELAEKCKQVFEGMETMIPVKYKKPMLLQRTPIIMTTNHLPWRYCSNEEIPFKNRMWIFDFKYSVQDCPILS